MQTSTLSPEAYSVELVIYELVQLKTKQCKTVHRNAIFKTFESLRTWTVFDRYTDDEKITKRLNTCNEYKEKIRRISRSWTRVCVRRLRSRVCGLGSVVSGLLSRVWSVLWCVCVCVCCPWTHLCRRVGPSARRRAPVDRAGAGAAQRRGQVTLGVTRLAGHPTLPAPRALQVAHRALPGARTSHLLGRRHREVPTLDRHLLGTQLERVLIVASAAAAETQERDVPLVPHGDTAGLW